MNYKDEKIFEQYFSHKNMNRKARNFYINLLLHTKDISDSEVLLNSNATGKYDFAFLNLTRDEEDVIKFNGGIYNTFENRSIEGYIVTLGNKCFVETHIYRFNDTLSDDNREYSVRDEFVFKDYRVFRKSTYNTGYFEGEVLLFEEMELEEYLENKCDEIKLKLNK